MQPRWWLWGVVATGVAVMAAAYNLHSKVDKRVCGCMSIEHLPVAENGPITVALDRFKFDVGHYPNELIELVELPTVDEEATAKWRGPYIKNPDDLKDAWGQPLRYRYPGKLHPDSYDLWSVGRDGESGTDDDISN